MSQAKFLDPVVTVNPALTGVGNGTLTVDRLTHFTIGQVYTATCIAKSPDTLFAITGSLDGPVGIAIVGTQFYDTDLKVFLTIAQGATAFEIGDYFTFTVGEGTDLNQDNIDDYDEAPQKNFGAGVKGTDAGDHNLRYISTNQKAYRYIQDLLFEAVALGSGGDAISVQYFDPVPAVAASLTLQNLIYTAQTAGAAGNGITIEYEQFTPATKARVTIQDIEYEADAAGAAGNSITVEYTAGGTAGAEAVSVIGTAITVQIESGVSTATQVKAAVDAFPAAAALVNLTITGTAGNAQTAPAGPTNLATGTDAFGEAGDEEVSVVGNAITVTLESGVSTATQVKAAIDGYGPAAALVSVAITGPGGTAQTAPAGPTNLTNGADSYGYAGDEEVQVTGSAISIYFESGKSTAAQIKTAFDAVGAATALATCTVAGVSTHTQYGPQAARNLIGGKNKYFSFNHHELTDAGAFTEGNAGVRLRDLKAIGKLEVTGHSKLSEALTLDDQNADNASGPTVINAQKMLNELAQNDKIIARIANDTKFSWSAPNLSFTDNIVLEFPDVDITNTIASSASPISISDGQSAYILLNRVANATATVVVANTVPRDVQAFRLATRSGTSLRLWDGTLIRSGFSARPGEGGLTDVVDDTTPQLGGNLDVNGFEIGSVSNGDVVVNPHGTGKLAVKKATRFDITTDTTTTGSAASLAAFTTTIVRVTDGSLASIGNIPAGGQGQVLILMNVTGVDIDIINDAGGTAANRIITGTGDDLTLEDTASLWLAYDNTTQRWRVIGGSGAGGGGEVILFGTRGSPRNIVAGTGITSGASHMSTVDMDQVVFIQGNGGPVTVTASPAIEAHTIVGARMKLIGRSDTNTVTLTNASGSLELQGDRELGASDVLELVWDGTAWVEEDGV